MTLTKARRTALVEIAEENDRGRKAHKSHIKANAATLDWLRKNGLTISWGPFAFEFHALEITPAGRVALENQP